MELKVVDLFCGAGGLSEGFRQAGFKIVAGLDKDSRAVETFRKNQPESLVLQTDILDVPPKDLPKCDVLIGGPPCVEFSSSKGGKGNVLEGLVLVQAFMRAVYEMKPQWWIMENVPRITRFLPSEVPLRWIGIKQEGNMAVERRAVFNTADYGVPQTRRRFLMGNFPIPDQTHENRLPGAVIDCNSKKWPWRTLGEALRSLPNPVDARTDKEVIDFNYCFAMPSDQLSDHYHDCVLNDDEVRQIRRAKELHPYMGIMAFPDKLDRPARTVVATQLGRETLVIGTSIGGRECFRRATIRECAVLQTFPITYQFWGNSLGVRYRLVGDAVPPMLGYQIACAILEAEDKTIPDRPHVRTKVLERSPVLPANQNRAENAQHQYQLSRRFRESVPGKEIRGCRVDLDNQGTDIRQAPLAPVGALHICQWVARLCVGEGKIRQQRPISIEEALKELVGFYDSDLHRQVVTKFLRETSNELDSKLPDATTLQASWCGLVRGVANPYQVVEMLSAIVDRHFPRSQFHGTRVLPSGAISIVPKSGLRLRILAGLVVTSYACKLINEDYRWIADNGFKRFKPPSWRCLSEEHSERTDHPIRDLTAIFSETLRYRIRNLEEASNR
jgi:DNA (cytosine-5)-methyltransferase 1